MPNAQETGLNDEASVLLAYAKGSRKRRHILQALELAPKNCNQLAQELGSDWWTTQKHLQQLMKYSLVKGITFGRIKFYKLTPQGELISKSILLKLRERATA